MRRHLLDPIGTTSVEHVVGRLGAVADPPGNAADLAIAARREAGRVGDVHAAVADGRLIRTFAFRGGTYLFTPEDGGSFLALRASSRMWELPSWREFYRLEPGDWPEFRATVREALAHGPLTRRELGEAVTARARYGHLGFVFTGDNWTLIKPLTWLGDMSFGSPRDGEATFQRLDRNPRWAGIPDLDAAGPAAVTTYLRAYAPTTPDRLRYWLGEGLGVARTRLAGWLDALRGDLATVDVDGEAAFVFGDDLDELLATGPSAAVRLLPVADPWVFGPGTKDTHVVPSARRSVASSQRNLLTVGGVVCGTWSLARDVVTIAWFAAAGDPPTKGFDAEVARLSTVVGRALRWAVVTS